MSDFKSGAFTANLDPGKTVVIRHHQTRVGSSIYPNVEMKDILVTLTKKIGKSSALPGFKPHSLGPPGGLG